jgi:hypothetical protein
MTGYWAIGATGTAVAGGLARRLPLRQGRDAPLRATTSEKGTVPPIRRASWTVLSGRLLLPAWRRFC